MSRKKSHIQFSAGSVEITWESFLKEHLSLLSNGQFEIDQNFVENIDWHWWFERAARRDGDVEAVEFKIQELSFGKFEEKTEFKGVKKRAQNETGKQESFALPITYKYSNPCIFLDRDGVINIDKAYVSCFEEIEWVDGVVEFIKNVRAQGYRVVVLTNQSGIARGMYKLDDVKDVHQKMDLFLKTHGALIDGWFFCPYHGEGEILEFSRKSLLRKPRPAMALLAAQKLNLDLRKSLMIGDKKSDRLEGLDMKTFFLKGHYDLSGEENVFTKLSDIYEVIKREYPILL